MKKIVKQPFVWLFLLSCIYLISRLINITALPIFTDEAIYIRWAQIGGRDASWRFISLTDGKQPLFTWAMMVSLRLFSDPLFAGRIVSVISGLFGMIGMYFLGAEIFKNKRIGLIGSFLYFIFPFALFYDRLALYDSLVSALSVWNLYLAILLVRRVSLDIALIFGLTLGVGMLNKTSAFFSLYLLPFTLFLFDWKTKRSGIRLLWWVSLALISAVLSQLVYSILRLSPYFYIIAQKDTIFVYPFTQWITHPFQFFIGNLRGMFDWLVGYMTWPVFGLSIASLIFFQTRIREKLLLFTWWFLPFAALSLFGRVLYPRFILFMIMPLLIMSAWTIDVLVSAIKNQWLRCVLVGLIFWQSMFISYSIISNIKTARIPKSELGQYINDWPSGWGIPEIVTFLKDESVKGKVSVFTEGTFGLLPYAFEIYLGDNKNIDIHGIWPVPTEIPMDVLQSAKDHPTYFVMYQNQTPPFQWHLELQAEYQKGLNKKSTMRLYKVLP
ncbi:glycosyltransferase family 39 protein [Patescibacteria group bacterium]|nr:glycosyltransferase family 39 protein [Patescibacteria group bacterium]